MQKKTPPQPRPRQPRPRQPTTATAATATAATAATAPRRSAPARTGLTFHTNKTIKHLQTIVTLRTIRNPVRATRRDRNRAAATAPPQPRRRDRNRRNRAAATATAATAPPQPQPQPPRQTAPKKAPSFDEALPLKNDQFIPQPLLSPNKFYFQTQI